MVQDKLRMDSGWLRMTQDGPEATQDGAGRLRMARDVLRTAKDGSGHCSVPEQRAGARKPGQHAENAPNAVPGRLRMAQDGLRMAQDGLRTPLEGPGAKQDEPGTVH